MCTVLEGLLASCSKLQPWKCAGQKIAVCDPEGKAMRYSCMPCNPVAVGVTSTTGPNFRTVGLLHSSCLVPATQLCFESDPGGKTHRSSNPIAARDNLRVRELQCGEANFARRKLALEPVPVTVLVLAHPSCRESVTYVMCKNCCNMSSSFSVGFQSHKQSSAAWTR